MIFSPANLLRNRVFWLVLVFAICLAGFPRGYSVTIMDAGGLVFDNGELMLANGQPIGGDYAALWQGGHHALAGEVMRLYDPAEFKAIMVETYGPEFAGFKWLYPPHWLAVHAPFAALPYTASLFAFIVSTLILFLIVCWRATRDGLFVLMMALSPTMIIAALFGQNSFLMSAFMIAGLFLYDHGSRRSGAMIGLLTLKPQFGLVLPAIMLAQRQWQAIAAAVVACLALLVLSVAVYGIEPWLAWLTGFGGAPAEKLATYDQAFLSLQLSVHAAARLAGGGAFVAAAAQIAVTLAAMAFAVIGVRSGGPAHLKACLVIACSYLATPYVMIYDLPALSFVCLWLYLGRGGAAADLATSVLALMILALPFLNIILVNGGLPLAPLFIAGLIGCILRELYRHNEAGEGSLNEPLALAGNA